MSQFGFWFDMTRCVGCKACQVACKEEKGVPPGSFLRRVELHPQRHFRYSGACNHCADPACVCACPTGAMYRSSDGLVLHNDAACIGCGRCVHACPYGAPFLDETTGLSRKCDACGGAPVCVAACPTRALDFGSPEELRTRHGDGAGRCPVFLPSPGETSPALRVDGLSEQLSRPEAPEPVSLSPEPPPAACHTGQTYIILGGGGAAVTAARELRRRDSSGRILLISDEPGLPYSRPMLSKALLRGFRRGRYALVDSLWLEENRVELIAGSSVVSLDSDRHTVTLADGRQYDYDKCIYALGAEASVPPVSGVELKGVFTLRKMTDIQALRQALPAVWQIVVVGGGAIGLEAACHLAGYGLAVTVVESLPHLMERQLGLRISTELRARLEAIGITVLTDAALWSIRGTAGGAVESVILNDRVIPAQLVLLSTGVRPNTAIAQAAGLTVGRYVEVETTMETSAPDLYACGDCAACRGQGETTWIHAQRQATIAAINAAGGHQETEPALTPLLLHVAGTSLFSVGNLDAIPENHILHGNWDMPDDLFRVNLRVDQRKALLSVCFNGNELTGAALMGDLALSAWLEKAVAQRMPRERFQSDAMEKGVVFLER